MYPNGSLGYGSMESSAGEGVPYGSMYLSQTPYYQGMMVPGYTSQYIQSGQNYAMAYPSGNHAVCRTSSTACYVCSPNVFQQVTGEEVN